MDIGLIKRSFNVDFINSILNHLSIREGALVEGYADCQDLVNDHRNILLTYEHGAIFYHFRGNGCYGIHIQALKEGRGNAFRMALQDSFRYMFTQIDCELITAEVRKDNLTCMAVANRYMNKIRETEDYVYFNLNALGVSQ